LREESVEQVEREGRVGSAQARNDVIFYIANSALSLVCSMMVRSHVLDDVDVSA
jgi:hypothetical protein